MKKVFLFLVLILTAFLIAGCWPAIDSFNNPPGGQPGVNNSTATHKACVSGGSITGSAVGPGGSALRCVTVNGAGANQCTTDADCINSPS